MFSSIHICPLCFVPQIHEQFSKEVRYIYGDGYSVLIVEACYSEDRADILRMDTSHRRRLLNARSICPAEEEVWVSEESPSQVVKTPALMLYLPMDAALVPC